jgi:hypothetical protein
MAMVNEIRPNRAIIHSKLLYDSPIYGETGSSGGNCGSTSNGHSVDSNSLVTGRGNLAAARRILTVFLAVALDGLVEMVLRVLGQELASGRCLRLDSCWRFICNGKCDRDFFLCCLFVLDNVVIP